MKALLRTSVLAASLLPILLTSCTYTNVPPARGAASILPLEEGSPVLGGADLIEGPTGVIVEVSVSSLPEDVSHVAVQLGKECGSGTGTQLAELRLLEGNGRAQHFLPGASLTDRTKTLIGQVVTVRVGSGTVIACGDIKLLH